jgi:hypothetical protein
MSNESKGMGAGGACGGTYGLAAIGVAVFYIQHSTTFGGGVLGILKAVVWPAIFTYRLCGLLHLS